MILAQGWTERESGRFCHVSHCNLNLQIAYFCNFQSGISRPWLTQLTETVKSKTVNKERLLYLLDRGVCYLLDRGVCIGFLMLT